MHYLSILYLFLHENIDNYISYCFKQTFSKLNQIYLFLPSTIRFSNIENQ